MAYTIGDLVEHSVDRVPDRVVLVQGERSFTFRQLEERANRLAHHLRSVGVGPDDKVAVAGDVGHPVRRVRDQHVGAQPRVDLQAVPVPQLDRLVPVVGLAHGAITRRAACRSGVGVNRTRNRARLHAGHVHRSPVDPSACTNPGE